MLEVAVEAVEVEVVEVEEGRPESQWMEEAAAEEVLLLR